MWKYDDNEINIPKASTGLDMATANGGRRPSGRVFHTGGAGAISATPGTAQTPVITETYFAEVFVPSTITLTGIAVFNGTDVTGNIKLGIYSIGDTGVGTLLAQTASTAGSGTATYQRVPLTAAITLPGPATYWIARQASSATARPCAHTAGTFGAAATTGDTYGTLPTAPTLPITFTTAVGPIATLY